MSHNLSEPWENDSCSYLSLPFSIRTTSGKNLLYQLQLPVKSLALARHYRTKLNLTEEVSYDFEDQEVKYREDNSS
jgi:hypothetical protein